MMIEIDFEENILHGRYPSMDNYDYHEAKGISASGIKKALAEPQVFLKKHLLHQLPSPAMDMGTALHEAVLEPAKFHISKYNLKPADEDRLKVMINNSKVIFNYILKNTSNEHSFFYKDEVLGTTRKVRVDAYDEANGIIYDVKSTKHNTPSEFMKDAYRLGYHVQGAWYLDTLKMLGYPATQFKFLCQPSQNPFDPFAVEMSADLIEDGRAIYSEMLLSIMDMKERRDHRVTFAVMDLPLWRREQLGL